jgi:hypothetical protein
MHSAYSAAPHAAIERFLRCSVGGRAGVASARQTRVASARRTRVASARRTRVASELASDVIVCNVTVSDVRELDVVPDSRTSHARCDATGMRTPFRDHLSAVALARRTRIASELISDVIVCNVTVSDVRELDVVPDSRTPHPQRRRTSTSHTRCDATGCGAFSRQDRTRATLQRPRSPSHSCRDRNGRAIMATRDTEEAEVMT